MRRIPSWAEIKNAHERIQPYIEKTPVRTSAHINRRCGAELFFKCENEQKIGAFKARGALNAVLKLSDSERKRGVATHSSGNHAQALALAAKLFGIKAWIVMPENTPEIKLNGVRKLDAEIVLCQPTLQAREENLRRILKEKNAVFIPPFNHLDIIEGQATSCKELLEEIPSLDFVLAPVGGGGLLSGTALTAHYMNPEIRVYGCEPENMNDAWRSFHSGKIEDLETGKTSVADGLRTTLGEITFGIIRTYVRDILTVPEEEIIPAMRLMWDEGIDIEPSSAVAVAAAIRNTELFRGRKVGIILSGGNVDKKSF